MALEFLTDAEVDDAGLVIRLDLDGVHALMRVLETAIEARLEPVAVKGGGGFEGEAANAFERVSVVILDPGRSDEEPAASPGRRRSAGARAG
ncbi:MAG TPA: hypothetical protein VF759_01965 [Allosphingosinicella sp.]|jgi:hypothetical protein